MSEYSLQPKILVIEDEPQDFSLVVRALNNGGVQCRPTRVVSEEQLLAEISSDPPALILSDHGVPGFGGFEALDIIREKCPGTPLIFVSGSADVAQATEAKNRGAAGWIDKSNLKALIPLVRDSLRADRALARPASDPHRLDTEQQFDLLAKAATDTCIFLLDSSGAVTGWNSGAEAVFGFGSAEIHGKNFAACYLSEDREVGQSAQHLKLAGTAGEWRGEGWRVRKDGTHFMAEVRLIALRDQSGQVSGFAQITRNVTERLRREEALRRCDERYIKLADLCREGVVIISQQRIVSVNRATLRLLGATTNDQVVGLPAEKFFPAIGRELFLDRLCRIRDGSVEREVVSSAEPGWFAGEVAIRLDGTPVPVAATAAEVLLNDGGGVMLVLRDIASERTSTAAAREGQRKLGVLLKDAPSPIIELDERAYITGWNPAAAKLFHCTEEHALGRCFEAVIGVSPLSLAQLRIAAEQGIALKRVVHRADGAELHIELVVACREPAAGPATLTVFVRDLTDKTRREESLRQTQALLRLFVEAVEDENGICLLDRQGRIVVWNRGAERLYGYSSDEIVGQHVSCLYTMEDAQSGKPGMHLRVAKLEGEYREESWRMRKDCSRTFVSVVITALCGGSNELHGFLVITRGEAPPAQERSSSATTRSPFVESVRSEGALREPPTRAGSTERRSEHMDPRNESGKRDPSPAASAGAQWPLAAGEASQLHPFLRAQQANEATSEARHALERLAAQTRTPWGTPSLLTTTQVLELEKTIMTLNIRLEQQEIALLDAQSKVSAKGQELARLEALLSAREQVLAAEREKVGTTQDHMPTVSAAEAAALRQLKVELERHEEALQRRAAELKEREIFIEQSEATLIEKMQEHQEREIELEQKQEDIQQRMERLELPERL